MGGKGSKERAATKTGKGSTSDLKGTPSGSTTSVSTPKKPEAVTSSPSGSPVTTPPATSVQQSTSTSSANLKKGSSGTLTQEADVSRSGRDPEKSDKKQKKQQYGRSRRSAR